MALRRRKYHGLSDDELYRLLSSTSEAERNAAFEELYHRHSHRIYLYCLKAMGDPATARDACQETFILLWRSVQPDRVMTNFAGYLLRIARNVCLGFKRREHPTVEFAEMDMGVLANPLGEATVEQAELAQLVSMALELLPEHYRQAIVLQFYNDLSYQEVADVLEVPLTTVRNWIARGKAQLRKILEPYWRDVSSQPSEDRDPVQVALSHHRKRHE